MTAGLGGSVGKKGRPRGKGLCLGERPGRQGTPPNARCRGEACWQEPGTTSWGMESCPERAPPGRLPLPGRSQGVEMGYLQTPAWPPALPSRRTPDGAPGLPVASAPALALQDTCSHDGAGAWTRATRAPRAPSQGHACQFHFLGFFLGHSSPWREKTSFESPKRKP